MMFWPNPVKYIRSYQLVYFVKNYSHKSACALLDGARDDIDVNLKDIFKKTALYYALQTGQWSIAINLLNKGAIPYHTYQSFEDKQISENAFHIAAKNSITKVVDYLIENFPELILVGDSFGENPFDKALKKSSHQQIESFLNYLDNPQNIEKLKLCPKTLENLANYFIEAVEFEQSKRVFLFLEKYNLFVIDSGGDNLLIKLCLNYNNLYKKPSLFPGQDYYSAQELTKLRAYAYTRHQESIIEYIKKLEMVLNSRFIDIDHQNNKGINALMVAVENNSYDIADLLLQAGIDVLAKNNLGQNVLDLKGPMKTESSSIVAQRIDKKEAAFIEKIQFVMEKQKLSKAVKIPLEQTSQTQVCSRHKI